MVVTYPDKYCSCHYAVVVVAFYCSHFLAVFLELVKVQLVRRWQATFYVEPVAESLNQEIYDHWFCRGVGVETPPTWSTLFDFGLRGATIEVVVFACYLV